MWILYKTPRLKPFFYILNHIRFKLLQPYTQAIAHKVKKRALAHCNTPELKSRIDYYNKLLTKTPLGHDAIAIKKLKIPPRISAQFLDMFEYARFFNPDYKIDYELGDVIHIPHVPQLVKSRPIGDNNANSILLKTDKYRHFKFLHDSTPFAQKKNMLLGRLSVRQQHRLAFYDLFFNHPLCNLGQSNTNGGNSAYIKPYMTIKEQLSYKFILCLEGNDVATNLKWVMSSNSIAVMPKPKYETWFMEGSLIPDFHYICIADDYSNTEEKITYYSKNTEEAEKIVRNAHAFVNQFTDDYTEFALNIAVLEKYFQLTI